MSLRRLYLVPYVCSSDHKLEFLVGDTVLPYNMTVYQAVRQFGEQNDADTDTETPLGRTKMPGKLSHFICLR